MPRPSPFGKDSLLLEGICPQKSAHIPAHVAIRIVDGIGGGLSNDLHSGKDSLLLASDGRRAQHFPAPLRRAQQLPRPSPFGKDSLLLEGICPQIFSPFSSSVTILY